MNTIIIISAHGSIAEQLLKSVEMILGNQKNVIFINFFLGENIETLSKKFSEKLFNFDINFNFLFLVDTWGGTPFNAATNIIKNKINCDIVTGVNIPMLLEIFMARDENLDFKDLVKLALNSGKNGIKSLNSENLINKKYLSSDILNIEKINNINYTKDNYMKICLVRIDDRLVHGQVVTKWTRETKVKRIIVVNDTVYKDSFRKTLITQISPPGVTVHVVSIKKAIKVYHNTKYANERVMLLITNPKDVILLIKGGIKIHSVNIGGMAYKKGKIQIDHAISVDKEDIENFLILNKLGIELEVRKVFNDHPLNMIDLIKKIKNKHNFNNL